ncbi:MAG: hypothetical protein V3U24_08825 [Candidatus Neomarinimicrobiota bacterium]
MISRGLERYSKTGSEEAIFQKRILEIEVLQSGTWFYPASTPDEVCASDGISIKECRAQNCVALDNSLF